MDIKSMTIQELKALGFDVYQQITLAQNNLQLIHQEIQKRNEVEVDTGKKK